MKKYLCFILSLFLCVTLAACAASDANSTTENEYWEYELLLAYLEAGRFDDARDEIDRLEFLAGGDPYATEPEPTTATNPQETMPPVTAPPATMPPETTVPPETTAPPETEPQWQTVEITSANFHDYFKPVQMVTADWNGFGELEMVHVYCHFIPRDGLELNENGCQLAIEISNQWANYEIVTDPAAQDVHLGACLESRVRYDDPYVVDFLFMYTPEGWYFNGYYAGLMTDSPAQTTIWIPSGYKLTRVQGTITVRGTVTDDTGAKG